MISVLIVVLWCLFFIASYAGIDAGSRFFAARAKRQAIHRFLRHPREHAR